MTDDEGTVKLLESLLDLTLFKSKVLTFTLTNLYETMVKFDITMRSLREKKIEVLQRIKKKILDIYLVKQSKRSCW